MRVDGLTSSIFDYEDKGTSSASSNADVRAAKLQLDQAKLKLIEQRISHDVEIKKVRQVPPQPRALSFSNGRNGRPYPSVTAATAGLTRM